MGLFDFLKSKTESEISSEGAKLFLIAKEGIIEICNKYKSLSEKGKLEVAIFNVINILNVYSEMKPTKLEHTAEEVHMELIKFAKKINTGFSEQSLIDFINQRFDFYEEEIELYLNQGGYIPAKIYTAFYLTPLLMTINPNFDLSEMVNFSKGFVSMIKIVVTKSEKFCNNR